MRKLVYVFVYIFDAPQILGPQLILSALVFLAAVYDARENLSQLPMQLEFNWGNWIVVGTYPLLLLGLPAAYVTNRLQNIRYLVNEIQVLRSVGTFAPSFCLTLSIELVST